MISTFLIFIIEKEMKMLYYYLASFGTLAQLAEQLTLNQWVKGSNPLGSTRKKPTHR